MTSSLFKLSSISDFCAWKSGCAEESACATVCKLIWKRIERKERLTFRIVFRKQRVPTTLVTIELSSELPGSRRQELEFKFLKRFRGYQRSANSGPVWACLLNAQNKDVANHGKDRVVVVFKRKPANPARRDRKKGDSLLPKYNPKSQSLFSLYPLSYYYLQTVAQPTSLSTDFRAQKSEIEDSHITFSTKPYRTFWGHSKLYIQLQDWGIAKTHSCFI